MFDYEKRCKNCKEYLAFEKKKWETIYEILDRNKKMPGK